MFDTGIDQHRHRSTLASFTPTGERVGEATVVNDRTVLTRYFWSPSDRGRSHRPLVLAPGDSGEQRRHRRSKDGNRYLKLAFGRR